MEEKKKSRFLGLLKRSAFRECNPFMLRAAPCEKGGYFISVISLGGVVVHL